MPDLSFLKVFIARTNVGEFLAGYTNSPTIPSNWPLGIGLETLFKPNYNVTADGIIQIPVDIQFTATHLIGETSSSLRASNITAEELHRRARIVRRSVDPPRPLGGDAKDEREHVDPRPDQNEPITTQAPKASEAEDWVEEQARLIYPSNFIRRIGHTSLERVPMSDGDFPGADIIVFDALGNHPQRFIEVKSAVGSFPSSIGLTASELRRAKSCAAKGLPFDIWVVVFQQPTLLASVISNFEKESVKLTIDDLVRLDIRITEK